MSQLFRTKSIDRLIEQSQDPRHRLKRVLGPWSLIGLGIGAVIGTGIFVLTGTAAAGESVTVPSIIKAPVLDLILHGGDAVSTFGRPGAGPGIALSFLLTAVVCGLAALCYAELASMIPVAGSAYTFAYATMGELIAWIIGWDLILEYAVSNMAVAVGFSAYFNDVLDSLFGLRLPEALSRPPIESGEMTGAIFNLPAFLVLMILTVLLVRGIRESAKTNNAMVLIKVAAILVFVFGAARAVDPANYQPFLPNGFHQDFHFDPGTGTVYTTPLRTTRLSQAEHCASPSPVAASASSHRSQTLIERVEPRSGRACSLQNGFEPKAVDPRPVKATRSAAAAPRSCVACQRTAAGSDAPPPAATSSSGHA